MDDPDPCLGELALNATARSLMTDALLDALDIWVGDEPGVPRSSLHRRLLLRIRRLHPRPCPALHLPHRVSMTRHLLRLHFRSAPWKGPNFIALPALSNHDRRIATSGAIAVIRREIAPATDRLRLAPDEAAAVGFALSFDGAPLAVELCFDGSEPELSLVICAVHDRRMRGLLTLPTGPADRG